MDLVEKDRFLTKSALFWCERWDLNPYGITTRPSNVRVCRFRHSRSTHKIIANTADIVKGFEYDKNKFVTMTDEDFEKAKSEKDRAIHILHFTDLSSIPPIYFDKTYHVLPEAGGDKAFSLLRRAMLDAGKIAVAKTVLGTKETLLALMPTRSGVLMETLFYRDEVKAAPKEPAQPEISDEELSMAQTLISSMDKPFTPAAYHDEYQSRLREIIEAKIAGKEIVTPPEERPGNVIDLMEALKASIEQAQGEKPKTPRKRKQA